MYNQKESSGNIDSTESIYFKAGSSGYWRLQVERYAGTGNYSFALTITAESPPESNSTSRFISLVWIFPIVLTGIIVIILLVFNLHRRSSRTEPVRAAPISEEPLKSLELTSSEDFIIPILFQGNLKGMKCAICKLDLRENQKILQCPISGALFHDEHLKRWLEKKARCPVCACKMKT